MKRLRYMLPRSIVGNVYDAAYLSDDQEATTEALVESAYQSISTELLIEVEGITMFAAAWEDPTHWSEDWADKLGVEVDEVPEAVADLLASAVESE